LIQSETELRERGRALLSERESFAKNDSKKNDERNNVFWFTVPFISKVTEKFKQLNKKDVKVSFYNFKTK